MHLRHSERGVTLVEYIVAAALLFIVATAAMEGLVFAASSSASSTMRAQALEIANQYIEQARNLPYDSVGTVSGFPVGVIPDVQPVGDFTVETDVEWASDKSALEPAKTITVTVSWTTGQSGSVVLQSNIAGSSDIKNTGDVKIVVVDADTAQPVPGVTVQITTIKGAVTSKATDTSGSVMWGQVPSGKLVITGSAVNYVLGLSQVASATVIANQMNTWTITAAKTSSGVVLVRDQSGNPLSGAAVTISGPSGVFAGTSAGGSVSFPGLLKGTYSVTATLAGYNVGSATLGVIVGGQSYTTSVILTKTTTLKIVVKDDLGTLLPGVTLAMSPPDATGTPTTDSSGATTFTVNGTGPYTVTASKAGYITGSATSGTLVAGSTNTLNVTIARILPCTLNLTVVDQLSRLIPGATVSVSGPGSVTGPSVTDSTGKATLTLSMPGVYTVQTSKTNYFTATASTGSIANGGTVALTVTMSQITTGTLNVTYTSNGSKSVYIYNTSHTIASTLSFTSRNQMIPVALLAGQYYASTRSSWPGTATVATAPYLNANSTVSVSLSSSN